MMIPVGYMAKRVSLHPDWLKAEQIVDLYSVSGCISKNFADYIPYWKHNGYWFFDAPEIIRQLTQEHSIDMHGISLFYYEAYELEFDEQENEWMEFELEPSFTTNVVLPSRKVLEGYDIVSFSVGTNAECSPLSCNHLATEVETNQHCLLDSLEQAQYLLESDKFKGVESGPYRIFAVYSVEASHQNTL
jgi:hypothetical protein